MGLLLMPLLRFWWRERIAPYSDEFFAHFDEILGEESEWTMPDGIGWITRALDRSNRG